MVSLKTDPCTIATLTTRSPSDVTGSSVVSGGDISDDGGDPVTDFGVIWSTQKDFVPNMASDDKTTQSRLGIRSFSSNPINLSSGTTYYMRAYAINGEGVAFGNQVSFTTLDKPLLTTNVVLSIIYGKVSNRGRNNCK